jgi:c-di-GMP-related signal transduction protein
MEVFVARQPIFNREKKIHGYELLFREGMSNFFSGIDGNTATSKVLSNSFLSIGIEELTGSHLAFINFTRELLLQNIPRLFSRERLVIEVLEDIEPDEEIVSACKELSLKGYQVALDDFFYRPDMEDLIAIADIIKFDFRATKIDDIQKIIKKISRDKLHLLAEKVETYQEFEIALKMGFEYFQGYFFSKPEILKGKDISSVQMNLLEIMSEINKPDFQFNKVEEIITRDVSISYKLMRYMNSAYFRRAGKISSIKEAIVLLGEKGIRNFLSLIAMTKLAENKPDELMRSSIIRAKFCELSGVLCKCGIDSSELFTLGLFSSIDAILDDAMENLMRNLPLSDELKKALVNREGIINDYLRLAMSYEKGDWDSVSELSQGIGINVNDLPKIFLDAINWADAITLL